VRHDAAQRPGTQHACARRFYNRRHFRREDHEPVAKTTKIDQVAFAGRSGQRYEFRIYVWDTKFKAVPGVYVVASRTMEPGQRAAYQPLFVGAGTDLSGALKDHPRDECFQMYYANVVGVLKEEDQARRAQIVADLLDGLSPPCNASEPV
jgi:hypothetical protein